MAIKTVGVVTFKETSVLLVRHKEYATLPTGSYGLPAGRIKKGERAITAARRELREETGYTAKRNSLQKLPIGYTALILRNGQELMLSMTVYYCKALTGTLQESEETVPEWIEMDKLSEINLLPNVLQAINQAFELRSTTERPFI